jgi:hypothetical protein
LVPRDKVLGDLAIDEEEGGKDGGAVSMEDVVKEWQEEEREENARRRQDDGKDLTSWLVDTSTGTTAVVDKEGALWSGGVASVGLKVARSDCFKVGNCVEGSCQFRNEEKRVRRWYLRRFVAEEAI